MVSIPTAKPAIARPKKVSHVSIASSWSYLPANSIGMFTAPH